MRVSRFRSALAGSRGSSASGREGRLVDDAAGAFNATAAMLPFVLSFGFIVYGALGELAARTGLSASLLAYVGGGAVMILLSRARLPTASPSASASLILGGTVLALLQDPQLAPASPGGLARLLAATAAVVVGSGLLMTALGLAGAGRLVRYVPRPVLAGFMNGVAILIVVSQLPPLLGLTAGNWALGGFKALLGWQLPALVVAAGTALLMVLVGWRWPRAPAPLVALVVAALLVAAWQAVAGPASAAAALPRVGEVAFAQVRLDTLAPWLEGAGWAVLAPHARMLATTSVVLALIGAMESALNLAAVDELSGERTAADRELVAVGVANIASGLFGGLPLVYLRLRAVATWNGGGRGPRAAWLGCALMGLVVTLLAAPIERLPTAVIAGIVVMLAWTLADTWTRELVRRWRGGQRSAELRWNLAVVGFVCAVTLVWGFAAGVVAGIGVALWIFVRTLHRQLVRTRFDALQFPSRRVYEASAEQRLLALRPGIIVFELEGALFFGNAERLLDEAHALPAGTATLIVDLRRVTTVDASGAVTLLRLAQQLDRKGIELRLSGLQAGDRHGRALAAHGVALATPEAPGPGLNAHADLDRALEAAELAALDPATTLPGVAMAVPLASCQLFEGLSPAQGAIVTRCLRERRLKSGERLFSQGDPGHALYVLTAGSISVVDAQRGQRFVSFSPGMSFGETAVLDGGGRTADARADTASIVHELDLEAFALLQREHPAIAARLYRNLATHLSQRLRAAAAAWRLAAE